MTAFAHKNADPEGGHHHFVPRRKARYFLTGLLTIIPLGVTVLVLYYLVQWLSAMGRPLVGPLADQINRLIFGDERIAGGPLPEWIGYIETGLSVIAVVVIVYFLGMMTANFLGRRVLRLFEAIMERIPFVKTVYGGVKKLVDLMRHDTGSDVQRVVLIEFPSTEMKTVGLVTRMFTDCVTGRKLAAVYVPTTPNPTSGYLEIVPVERITSTDWSFDEAMAFIMSGGAIAPSSMYYDRSAPSSKTETPLSPSSPSPPVEGAES